MFQEVKGKPVGSLALERASQDGAAAPPRATTTVDGMILAGTHSWGDDVLEHVAPRPLWPVALVPLIVRGIHWLRDGGVATAHICANSETSVLRARLGAGDSLGTSLTYYEDRMPRGPAGCARDASLGTQGDAIIILEGSIVPCVDLDALLDTHMRSQAALTVAVREAAGQAASRHGAGDRRPAGPPFDVQLEPIGIYVCSKSALLKVSDRGYQDIKEGWIPRLYADGLSVVAHQVNTESAPRITDSASYLEANLWAVCRLDKNGEADRLNRQGFRRWQQAWVHESARIAPTAKLKGPMLIGPKCKVGPGATIIGSVVLGRESVVERNALVSRSVLWDQCTIGAGAFVDQSILTHRQSVDAETVVRNTVLVASDNAPSKLAAGRR